MPILAAQIGMEGVTACSVATALGQLEVCSQLMSTQCWRMKALCVSDSMHIICEATKP